MNVAGLVAAAREAHERLMISTCTIGRLSTGAINSTTGAYTTTTTSVYSGKCRLRGPSAASASVRESDTGEAEQASFRYQLLIPYGSATVYVGDVATIGSRTFTVVGRVDATTTTAQALLVEEVEQ